MKISGRTVAAKTGTTQNFRDGWTLGFTPSLAAGVWAGNNDGTLLKNGSDGVVVAAPIWHDFMVKALGNTPNEDFPVPAGIQTVTVDSLTGLLPTQYTPSTKQDIFASYAVPTQYDNAHIPVSATGCAASNDCPSSGIYTELHSEMPNNPAWEDPVEKWGIANGYDYPPGGVSFSPSGSGSGSSSSSGTSSSSGGPSGSEQNNPVTNAGNPPTAQINSPADGSTQSQSFTVSGQGIPDLSNNNSIVRIDFLEDGAIVQSVSDAPLALFTVNGLPAGQHTLAIHVVDDKGNTADTSITVNIK
jgi:membrane peptidoglycan carboxypeptidase